MSKIRVLLVDDKESFCESFANRYDGEEYEVDWDLSLDKAKERLEGAFYTYHFVILDGLGHLTIGQTEGQGDDGFAISAIQALKELEQRFGRAMPYCLYTAFHEDRILNGLKQSNPKLEIFKKTKEEDEQAMWEYIRNQYKKLPETTIRGNYPDLFQIFEQGYLSKDVERELIRFLLALDNAPVDQYKQVARQVRPIMEAVFNKIATLDRKFVHAKVRQGDEQSLQKAIRHMAGNPTWNDKQFYTEIKTEVFMPIHLFYTISALQKATSSTAMHHTDVPITKYTLASYKEILADLLLWFKELVQKHK